ELGRPDACESSWAEIEEVLKRVKDAGGAPFEPKTLDALAVLKRKDEPRYMRARDRFKKARVPVRDLDVALRRHMMRVAESDERAQQPRVLDAVPDAPVRADAIVPAGYRLTSGGVSAVSGNTTDRALCLPVVSAPLLIAGRLKDVGDGTESVRLAWPRDGRWQHHTVSRVVIANACQIVELAGVGVPVTSTTASDVVRYLAAYEQTNLGHLPRARIAKQMGWQGERGDLGFLWGRSLIRGEPGPLGEVDVNSVDPEDWGEDSVFL